MNGQKFIKNVKNDQLHGYFWKSEAFNLRVLSDRAISIRQKLMKNAKIQMWHLGWFSNTVNFKNYSFSNLSIAFAVMRWPQLEHIWSSPSGLLGRTNPEQDSLSHLSVDTWLPNSVGSLHLGQLQSKNHFSRSFLRLLTRP